MAESRREFTGLGPRVSDIDAHTASIGITRFRIADGLLEWDARATDIFAAGADPRPPIDIWRDRVHPDDAQLLVDLYGDASENIGAECIYRIVLPDGSIGHVLTRSVSIEYTPDGTPEVLTGVVSRVHPHESTHQLSAALDSVSLGFAIFDTDLIIRYVNAQTEHHLGAHRSELLGRHLHEALPTTKGSYFDDLHRDAVRTRGEIRIEVPSLFIPGTIMEVTANYVDGVVAVSFRDITAVTVTMDHLLGAYRELLSASRLDDLTGVLNRAALFERIDRISTEIGAPAAVLFIDVDDFKTINDTHGHLIGDQVLRITAARLSEQCGTDIVLGRIGGDEFVAALFSDTELGSHVDPADIADCLRIAARAPIQLMKCTINIELSIGIARNTGLSTLEDLLTRADIALYEAKAGIRHIDRQ
ncbi:GGDEF domain-containing protein [Rhodococcoides fascians]|uniref:GGDEF domain-containing protein n=1 Tax=Rhodococcoides fascians TaxID=1828 RepID=UPI0005665833|nr:sensor domain-containing diguanylate cyclase [Rhodococcus fascians]